jgi:tetratricopeptide (TPR) repeat protein
MTRFRNISKVAMLFFAALVAANCAVAQLSASQARQYAAAGNYDKAIEQYSQLYGLSPDSVYTEYFNTLVTAKKYRQAEQLVEKQMTLRQNPYLNIDLGKVYFFEEKYDKAYALFDGYLQRINGDMMASENMVNAFLSAGMEDYAIAVYERTGKLIGGAFLFSNQLGRLYAKCGNLDKAVDALLTPIPGQGLNLETVKSTLLELLGNDADKLQRLQRSLVVKINEQPDNVYYVELLTWIFTQKSDWDGALIQMEAIDERGRENGNHLFNFARTAAAAKQYDAAIKAYDEIVAKGKELPYYTLAKSERLTVAMNQLRDKPVYTQQEADSVVRLYDSFLVEYPKYYGMQTGSDLALVLAQYDKNVPEAINVLNKGLADPDIRRDVAGRFKLQLGDYYLLQGKIWDASLTYSQVDKEFKQDPMGEDARFRNAKLAYYRGDFDWAQRQLTILKSATSELIANDAIYLSVLITENVQDSNLVPLQRFAYAGLLLFQNRDKEAEALLDSINKAYPEHPLNDDILMTRADMARKHHNFEQALSYLKTIYEKYGKDVLGDDAVFKTADIYQHDLHQYDNAKQFYEKLIIDYQGSTYVQEARMRLNELKNNSPVP